MFAVTIEDRAKWLPSIFAHQVEQTQYMKQNTLERGALTRPYPEYLDAIGTGKPVYFQAKTDKVYELASVVVDLDVGRGPDDLTAWDALAVVGNMTEAGELPLPSLAALSGRGAYLWWLLTSEDGRPPLNNGDNRHMWNLVVNDLLRRTADLKGDANAKRLANWYKRPDTIDTNTGKRVIYLTFGVNHPAAVPRYRLPELMNALELHHAPVELPAPAVPAPRKAKRRTKAKRTVGIPRRRPRAVRLNSNCWGRIGPRDSRRGIGRSPSTTTTIRGVTTFGSYTGAPTTPRARRCARPARTPTNSTAGTVGPRCPNGRSPRRSPPFP